MRFTSLALLIFLALTVAACGTGQTPVSTTAVEIPTETQMAPTDTPAVVVPTDTPSGPLGSISGTIFPPPVEQPATSIRVYARLKQTAQVFGMEIPKNQTTYTLSGLPMGTYTVFAWYYPDGVPGAYTSAGVDVVNTSADQLKCSNSLIEIVLTENKRDFQGADIACWAGDYFIYITPMP